MMMRLFIFALFLLVSVCIGAPIQIAPTRTTRIVDFSFATQQLATPAILAAKNDLLALHGTQTLVYKRTSDGQYQPIVTQPTPNITSFISYTATDGKWVAWSSIPLQAGQTVRCELFIPNDDGTISNFTVLDNSVIKFNYGDFLPDGSLIGIAPDALYTYQYIDYIWTLIDVSKFTTLMAMPRPLTSTGPFFPFTNNHLVTISSNYAEIHFYERQTNNSWSLHDNFTTGATRLTAAAWNGDDTVVATFAEGNNEKGIMYLYTSVNGTWSLASTTSGNDLGVTLLGTRVVSVDANTFIVAAYQQAILLQRNNGQWYLNGDFVGESAAGAYSGGVAFNSHDILFGHANGVSVAPLCSVRPVIDYTCNKTALDSCQFKEFDASLLCDYSNQCSEVITNVKSFGIVDYQVDVQFTLNRFGTFGTNVNVSFSCPAVSSPSTGNNNPSNGPSSSPSASSVPVNQNNVNGPQTNATSSAHVYLVSFWLVLALTIVTM